MMSQEDIVRIEAAVRRLRPRVLAGDDEALSALLLETKGSLLGLVPAALWAARNSDRLVEIGTTGIYEALLLWQPEREAFVSRAQLQIHRRLAAYFLASQDLVAAAVAS